MNYLHLNWFKLVAILGLILCLGFISYYFIYFAPEQKRERAYLEEKRLENEYLDNRIKCQKAGYEYWKREQSENEFMHYDYEPEYRFNKNLNTCLVQITYTNHNDTSEVSEIVDIYQNKTLVRHTLRFWNDEWKDSISTQEEWNLKVKEYFND